MAYASREQLRQYNREYMRRRRKANPQAYSAQSAARASTIRGRARILYDHAKERAKKRGLQFAITLDWIEKRLTDSVCKGEVTCERNRPNTASLDRVVSTEGYTPTNTRVAALVRNLGKSDFTEEEYEMEILKEFLRPLSVTTRDLVISELL
jgi:hypothetical protein